MLPTFRHNTTAEERRLAQEAGQLRIACRKLLANPSTSLAFLAPGFALPSSITESSHAHAQKFLAGYAQYGQEWEWKYLRMLAQQTSADLAQMTWDDVKQLVPLDSVHKRTLSSAAMYDSRLAVNPNYPLIRAERAILEKYMPLIAAIVGGSHVVDLFSGTAWKLRYIFEHSTPPASVTLHEGVTGSLLAAAKQLTQGAYGVPRSRIIPVNRDFNDPNCFSVSEAVKWFKKLNAGGLERHSVEDDDDHDHHVFGDVLVTDPRIEALLEQNAEAALTRLVRQEVLSLLDRHPVRATEKWDLPAFVKIPGSDNILAGLAAQPECKSVTYLGATINDFRPSEMEKQFKFMAEEFPHGTVFFVSVDNSNRPEYANRFYNNSDLKQMATSGVATAKQFVGEHVFDPITLDCDVQTQMYGDWAVVKTTMQTPDQSWVFDIVKPPEEDITKIHNRVGLEAVTRLPDPTGSCNLGILVLMHKGAERPAVLQPAYLKQHYGLVA